MPTTRAYEYSEAFKILVRSVWYDNGCISPFRLEKNKMMPKDEHGNIPSSGIVENWMHEGSWMQWKDVMDAQVAEKSEKELLGRKIEIIKEQLEQTREIRNKAYEAIKGGKFDTSASAVTAFFRAGETERGLMQIEKVISDLEKLETNDLQKQFRELAERAGATIVDGEEKIEEDSAEHFDT